MIPAPRDLPLPLPIPEQVLAILIVPALLLHLLFVNLTVGAALFSIVFEFVGRRYPKYDRLALCICETITVNKSLAVVLGIAPLLMISLLYTPQFYAANTLTGHAWVVLIPLITTAFLLAYVYKYTWGSWTGPRKQRHLRTGVAMAVCFLCIPVIFLSNVNLMLFPDRWNEVGGFFDSLRVGNVFPRYLHFLASSLAITGLFLAAWFGRKGFAVEQHLPEFTRSQLMRHFYRWAFYVSCSQFLIGPLALLTLPPKGLTTIVVVTILAGVAIALAALVLLSQEIRRPELRLNARYWLIAVTLGATALQMGIGRHLAREDSLAEHRQMVRQSSAEFAAIEMATHMRMDAGMGAGESLTGPPSGRTVFLQTCGACHSRERAVYAPALTEIYRLHQDHPENIVTWAKNPGKKRPEFTQMPSMAHLGDEALEAVAKFMLAEGAPAADKKPGEASQGGGSGVSPGGAAGSAR